MSLNLHNAAPNSTTTPESRMGELERLLSAIQNAYASIEFEMDGTILNANQHFLKAMGYGSIAEIRGRHHSMFCNQEYVATPAYREFWAKLRRGEFHAGEFQRFGHGGKEVWISASYFPVLDATGAPIRVMKLAQDITEKKRVELETAGKIAAILKSQAVIEFDLKGTVLTANENFCHALGYSLEEIRGKHHSMFCDAEYTRGTEYRQFWEKLNRGEFDSNQYRRLGKGGREIWIQASYNPIFDPSGKPYKVVKYASDITASIRLQQSMRSLVEKLKIAIASLNKMADEIGRQSANTAAGAESQSATVEQMSASVEELTASIQSISRNATEADVVASKTAKDAEDGGTAVLRSIEGMELIKKSSEQVSEIVGVIGEIASQTNLLALNAAIEAARAGENGLGFAVVADEVRKLAERAANATKEISTLIKESNQRVTQGMALSVSTKEALGRIVEGVTKTAGSIAQIAAATEEQSANANEVSKGVTNVGKLTEQSAANSQSLAESAKRLADQASELNQIVQNAQM